MTQIVPYNDIEKMANAVAASKLFGVKNPNEAIALMLVAQAEGMHPATAARDYHVIQGRPALKADAMLARFQQAGGSVQWKEYTDEKVTGIFSHPQGGTLELSWTMQQAKSIGIANKDNWKNYPRAMLRARVISEGIRSVYPGCVVGVYTPEEVADFSPNAPKDMGMAERVEDVPPPKTLEILEADGAFKLYVPGTVEPYAAFHTIEEWIGGYANLIFKIHNSAKLTEEQKADKLSQLDKENQKVITKMDSFHKLKLRTELVQLGVPQGPKASKSPSSVEPELSEGTSSDI